MSQVCLPLGELFGEVNKMSNEGMAGYLEDIRYSEGLRLIKVSLTRLQNVV